MLAASPPAVSACEGVACVCMSVALMVELLQRLSEVAFSGQTYTSHLSKALLCQKGSSHHGTSEAGCSSAGPREELAGPVQPQTAAMSL